MKTKISYDVRIFLLFKSCKFDYKMAKTALKIRVWWKYHSKIIYGDTGKNNPLNASLRKKICWFLAHF